jgi:hypothetical protein
MFSNCRDTQQPCILTTDPSCFDRADLVLFSAYTVDQSKDPPRRTRPSQLWAFFSLESPVNIMFRSKPSYDTWNGLFNWTITYRRDSDVHAPYGKVFARDRPAVSLGADGEGDGDDGGSQDKWPFLGSSDYSVKTLRFFCETI